MIFYDKVKEFVIDSFKDKKDAKLRLKHYENTVIWIKELKPNASQALLTAGFAHDIDRAFSKSRIPLYKKGTSMIEKDFLEKHEKNGSKIIKEFLTKINAPREFINNVCYLIAHHETGGNEEANLLKDADSISFFDVNLKILRTWINLGVPRKIVKEKIDWMYNRITSKEAKKIVKPWYEKARKLK